MGCCIAEIAMLVFGIVTLVKGTFQVSRNRVVQGTPAYLIGAILVAVLPTVLAIGFVAGVVMTAKAGRPPTPQELQWLTGVEPAITLLALVAVLTIGLTAGKPKQKTSRARVEPMVNPPYTPADPNNPYAAPRPDDRDRLLDELQ